jgi:hypothetical protein
VSVHFLHLISVNCDDCHASVITPWLTAVPDDLADWIAAVGWTCQPGGGHRCVTCARQAREREEALRPPPPPPPRVRRPRWPNRPRPNGQHPRV